MKKDDVSHLTQPLHKPMYVLLRSGPRMRHRATEREWVVALLRASETVQSRCLHWLDIHPDDGSLTRKQRRTWNGHESRRPSQGVV